MKNVNLKKLSAAALAAVMAVSFAPAASLNVFAEPAKENAVTASETIEKTKSYTLAEGCSTLKIETNDSGVLTVDLNGQTVDATIKAPNANVILTDADGIRVAGVVGGYKYATLKSLTSVSKYKTLSITGNMTVAPSVVDKADITKVFADNNKAVPVAVTVSGASFLVGNTVISAAAADANNIIAQNGDVEVSGLTKDHSATIGLNADENTTIKATAAANTALTSIVTTYTYYKNNKTGSGTYTDYAYYAGNDEGKKAVEGLGAVATSGAIAPKVASGDSVYSIPSYSRAITINTNGESWTSLISKTGSASDKQDTDKIFGLTYFTSDPSAYTTGMLAAIDGNKYVLGSGEIAAVTEKSAKKSVKVLRGSSATGNRTSNDTFPVATGVTVSGPADESVVVETATTVQGNTTTVTNSAIVFGTSESISGTYAKPAGTVSKRNVNVAQVAQGATVAFTADNGVSVSRGSGVGYYSYPSSTTQTKYTFGPTTVITNDFKNFVAPHMLNGLTIPAGIGSNANATVFASKEIKTTVAGVEKTITIKGETNAKVTATSGNTQTWEVNADAKPVTANPVVTYRLY
ncbi:MAG: hypothetical protein VZQ80_07465, partial [Lachnospiraceae bacterium]|nr:hypothetical protein [Lachnospiraceae bacterium]